MTLELAADLASVRAVGGWLGGLLAGLDPAEAAWLRPRLELAAHEVCINAVIHAGAGRLRVDGWVRDDHVELVVRDDGIGFDAELAASRRAVDGEEREHGFGLTIVERLVDRVRYERRDCRNEWWLRVGRSPDRRTEPSG